MQRCLHKATAKSQLPKDYSHYSRWEDRQYPGGPEREMRFPSDKKLSEYYKINGLLRIRLCKISRLQASDRRDALMDFIHRQLDENMGMIFHERNPEKWPSSRDNFTFRVPEKKTPVIRLMLPAPEAEPAITRPVVSYARAV